MARIRSIKPEFCSSEQLADCSPTARLLFVLMWLFCDDAGTHPASARALKMQCFPGDDFTAEQVIGWMAELIRAGLVVEFEASGKRYWNVTGWKHQKIDKPSYKYPKVSEGTIIDYHSTTVDDHSTSGPGTFVDNHPAERSLPESTGSKVIRRTVDEPEEPPPDGLDPEAWERWLDYRRRIRKPLKGPSIAAAQRALAQYGDRQAAVVDHSIANGYQGLFPPKDGPRPQPEEKPPWHGAI